MSLPRAAAVLVLAAVVSLAVTWRIQQGFAQEGADDPVAAATFGVEWDYRPASLGDLTAESQGAAVVEVTGVRSGEPFVVTEGFTVPTQLVDVKLVDPIEGSLPATFTIFKLGSDTEAPQGDSPYAAGERYLLFVRRRLDSTETKPNPDGTYLVTAPDGRFEVLPSGHLDAEVQSPVAAELDGETVNDAEQSIDTAEAAR